jgi:hypothetical protein
MAKGVSQQWTDWQYPELVRKSEEEAAGLRLPRAVPMYGTKTFTPQTRCSDIHRRPIPRGSSLYCEVCGDWGCGDLLVGLPAVPVGVPEPTTYDPPASLKGGTK